MTIYTPPALNAVDFELTSFTPEVLPANDSVLSVYTAPALNAVDFELSAYAQPIFPTVDFELLYTNQEITGTGFVNSQTFGSGVISQDGVTPTLPVSPGTGGDVGGDGGDWYYAPINTRQRSATVEDLKREAWAELEKEAQPVENKKVAPRVKLINKKNEIQFTDEELLLAWWKLRN